MPQRGAVLLEVLLALALFVFAATVITSSLNSGVDRVARLRAQLHAVDLAVSVLSEVKLGILPVQSQGPEPFEAPFDQWTWQVEAAPYSYGSEEVSALQLVTVIVKDNENTTVQRLTGILTPPPTTGALDSLGGAASDSAGFVPATASGVSVP
jgi:type II secretory pathway pseudopilin PulG